MIGILDSGLGGLYTARKIAARLPGADMIFFGDTARSCYGEKSPDTISRHARQGADFLLSRGARVLVVTCASISAVAGLSQRLEVPCFDALGPAAEAAAAAAAKGRIGVLSSPAAVSSRAYERRIRDLRPEATVHTISCPLVEPLLEAGWIKKPETAMIVKKYVHPLKTRQIEVLLAAGPHYGLIAPLLRAKVGKRVALIDSAETLAAALEDAAGTRSEISQGLSWNGKTRFFVSDLTEETRRTAARFYGKALCLESVSL